MKSWKNYCAFLVILIIFLATAAFGADKPAEKRALRIGLMPDIGMFPMLVAEKEGYFTAQKLNVQLTVFKAAKDRDAAFQGGQLDGTMSDLLATYFFNSNGFKVKASTITESRFLLLAAKDAGIKKLEDLQNVEIGLSLNTVIEYFVDSLLTEKQIKAKKLSIPQVPVRMELLRSGQLKAASMPDPLATVLTKSGAVILADSAQLRMDPAVLIFTDKIYQEQANTLKDFYIAYNRAVDAINKNPEKYRQLLLDKGGFPAEVIQNIVIPHFRHAVEPTQAEVNKIIAWAKAKGLEKKKLTYADLVQKGFVQ